MVKDSKELLLNELMISRGLLRRSITLSPEDLLFAANSANIAVSYLEVLEALPEFVAEMNKPGVIDRAFIAYLQTPKTASE